ncbi:MAG: alpha/beta hydrolase [Phycisphaerales bacterium]|nr:alpha/beta hydrolase [Phycisphaerales bacterium]
MANRMAVITALLGVLAGSALGQASKPAAEDWVGDWIGTLDVGAARLRLAFHLTRKDDKLSATMDSLDQGAMGIPANETTVDGETLVIRFKAMNGLFQGRRAAQSAEISGTWTQNGMDFPLTLKRGVAEAPKRPQEPRPPFPYDAIDVTFENATADGVTLAGTLTIPREKRPVPAVVLISGSGPQDRDESLLGHKPFLVLADHLTRSGIAVLRYDDRGTGASTGAFSAATTDDFAGDAEAAVAFLRERKEIDTKRIGLLGHSEGGLVAPIVAARNGDVAFVVLVAGPGLPGGEILDLQRELILKASGATPDAIEFEHRVARKVLSLMDGKRSEDEIRTQLGEFYDTLPAGQRAPLGERDAFISTQSKLALNAWLRHFVRYDPRPVLEKVKCPILAIVGEKDLQVPAERNIEEIRAAVARGGNRSLTTRIMPGLNHLLQKCETGAPGEYAAIEETMNPAALDAIATWIREQTAR